ncbi:MAG: hypothetical protein C0504_20285 [Candidatus Solibacter sp.]|nr:hypothetical protein [Candidatus Solibacter sp.]
MHVHDTFDSVVHANAWSARAAGDKALLPLSLLAAAILLPPGLWSIAPLTAACLAALAGARIPFRAWLRTLAPALGFSLLGVLPLFWTSSELAIGVFLRVNAASAALVLLILTTPADELLASLRSARVPAALLDLAILTLRMFRVLWETARSMSMAVRCRSPRGWRARARLSAQAAANLLPRALERASRVETALALRAGSGPLRLWTPARSTSWPFRLAAVAAGPALLLLHEVWRWA